MAKEIDIGAYSAYAIAVEHGYEGTEAEFAAQLMDSAANGALAQDGAERAEAAAAEAAETLESIPEDYTELVGEVDQLSEEVDILNQGGLNLNKDFIGEQVNTWLDDHPEATTTVQDKSLTIDKMVVGTLGYVTPEMFGAVGDGVTDDTESLQNALNSNYDVKIEGKEYLITQTLTVTIGKKIYGDGVIHNYNDIVTFNVETSDVVFEGITINGHCSESVFYEYGHAIMISGHGNDRSIVLSNIEITNVSFIGWRGDAVYIMNGENIYVKNCMFDGVHNNNRGGVSVGKINNLRITNNIFLNISKAGMIGAIDLETDGDGASIHHVVIANNNFSNISGAGCLCCSGSFGGEVTDVTVTSNTALNCTRFVTLNGSGNAVKNIIASNNTVKETQFAVASGNCSNIVMNSNTIEGNVAFLAEGEGCQKFTFTNNICHCSNEDYFLGVTNGIDRFIMQGNVFVDVSGATERTRYFAFNSPIRNSIIKDNVYDFAVDINLPFASGNTNDIKSNIFEANYNHHYIFGDLISHSKGNPPYEMFDVNNPPNHYPVGLSIQATSNGFALTLVKQDNFTDGMVDQLYFDGGVQTYRSNADADTWKTFGE